MKETVGLSDNARTVQVSYGARRYWERKNNRLCVSCGRENDSGKILCPECSARKYEEKRQDRTFYERLGLCNRCGKNRVFGSEKKCPECRAKARRNAERRGRTDKEREKNNDSCRRRYHENASQGICVKCGRRRALSGKVRCGICTQRQAERDRQRRGMGMTRAERYQYGLCYTCGSSLDMDGVKVCSRCYADLEKAREARGPLQRNNRMTYQGRPGHSRDAITENARKIFQTAPYAGMFME